MLEITLFHVFSIVITGMLLFGCVLYTIGLFESRHIKKRKRSSIGEKEVSKPLFLLFYLFVLILIIIVIFLIIDYQILRFI